MDRSVSRTTHDPGEAVDPARATEPGKQWVFVAHHEVGLLHRLRPVASASTSLILVRMDAGAHPCPDVQLGLAHTSTAPRLEQAHWFAGLSAHEVSSLLRWLAAEPGPASDLPVQLLRRRVSAIRLLR